MHIQVTGWCAGHVVLYTVNDHPSNALRVRCLIMWRLGRGLRVRYTSSYAYGQAVNQFCLERAMRCASQASIPQSARVQDAFSVQLGPVTIIRLMLFKSVYARQRSSMNWNCNLALER